MTKLKSLKQSIKNSCKKITKAIEAHPLRAFFITLGVLFILIIVGNVLRKPANEPKKEEIAKSVSTYQIGSSPKVVLSAQIEKSGVLQIVAQTSGIVGNVYFKEGDTVSRGQWLVALTSNYQGGNALSLARQLSEKQNQLVEESYPLQKDLIQKQKDIANEQNNNADKLREITSKSTDDTGNLINLNNDIISTLDTNLTNLEESPTPDNALILATKQIKSQFESANLQLNNALRNAQYQSDTNNPVNKLAPLSKDIALKQLEIQQKALDLNKEISKIQLNLARVNEGMMYPSSPVTGIVQKINVKVGQFVNPGTVLATISSTGKTSLKATVLTSKSLAMKVNKVEPSLFTVNDKQVSAVPSFISTEAVQSDLYSITYQLPEIEYTKLTDKSYIPVSIPIGFADTSSSVPFIPIDSVYQTETEAYLFVVDKDHAKEKKVSLGEVIGQYVQVKEGLNDGDRVILNRSVLAEDKVKVN
jgi:multidrug efflux pump subunit AcrA (membrane-fusion protein)